MKALTKVEIIEETAAFYNLGNRGYNSNTGHGEGFCVYRTSDNRRCGVGRCLTEKGLISFVKNGVASIKYEPRSLLENNLKEEYKGHEVDFWSDIQSFHDTHLHWNQEGISEKGIAFKKCLIERYEAKN